MSTNLLTQVVLAFAGPFPFGISLIFFVSMCVTDCHSVQSAVLWLTNVEDHVESRPMPLACLLAVLQLLVWPPPRPPAAAVAAASLKDSVLLSSRCARDDPCDSDATKIFQNKLKSFHSMSNLFKTFQNYCRSVDFELCTSKC